MLFNSDPFLFGLLPVALLGHQIAAHWHRRAVVLWLSFVSLAFYAYWRPAYLIVLCGSILFNYLFACLITRKIPNRIPSGNLLVAAIVLNLAALCFYKYLFPTLNFFSRAVGSSHHWSDVVLPLGISFFTFTQIAFLVDLQQGQAFEQNLSSYTLFVTFFPHLIAGPILHHAEMMPQFQKDRDFRLRGDDLAVGLTWFIMGLIKKVLLADQFAPGADAAFAAPASLHTVGAWAGVLAYALQLYFDFSGYSDMALGLARMFSIDFPLNFASPYKASSIIDFWQRWHMTLTRYITVYLYNPASMWISRRRIAHGHKVSRKAMATTSGFLALIVLPTLLTLLIAGLWHGAGMQFLIFGLLHGFYLSINHAWRLFRERTGKISDPLPGGLRGRLQHTAGVLLTFLAVLVGQVFFRASSVSAAISMLAAMLGFHTARNLALQDSIAAPYHASPARLGSLAIGYIIVWAMPNTQQILLRFKPSLAPFRSDLEPALVRFSWRPTAAWGCLLAFLFFYTVVKMQNPSTFLYFQF